METKKKKDKGRPPNAFIRYSGMALQMGIIIALGVFGGQKLDEHFSTDSPIFTIVLSLIGVAAALYLTIKDLNK